MGSPENPLDPAPLIVSPSEAEPVLRLDGSPAHPIPAAPARDPVWNGWDVLWIILIALVSLVAAQIAALVVAKVWLYPKADLQLLANQLAKKPILALISMLVSYIVVAAFMFWIVRGKYGGQFRTAIRWNPPAAAWRFPLLGLGLMFALIPLEHFLPMPKDVPFEQFFASPLDAYLTSVFAVTLGPLMEELFFRGFLYPVLVRGAGIGTAIVLTSVSFGLLHSFQLGYAWGAVLVIVIVGFVLTTVRAVTGSVAASLLTHIGYNGGLMLIAAIQTDGFRHMENAANFSR